MRAKLLSMNCIRCKMLIWHDSKFTVRRTQSSCMRESSRTIFDSVHDNKDYMEEDATNVYRLSTHETNILPYDMSTRSISTMCSAITTESSTSFEASSSVQVAAEPSPAASRLGRGYRDFKFSRVRLTDCFMLVRTTSRDRVGRLSGT
jgi:hypothetical protein